MNQPRQKSFFLPANLSKDARTQEQHLSITFECGLSASSLGAERSFIFGTILTCWELTHGEKDIGAGQRREIKVRETEDSLWKKVYLNLRKQSKSKAGHSCSKSEKWWSNSPLLHCLWQTVQVHSAPQVNTRRFQGKISFILICFTQVCWAEFTAVFFCFLCAWWECKFFVIIFQPLLGVLLPNFSSSFLVWNSRERGFPAEELADAMFTTLMVLAMMYIS